MGYKCRVKGFTLTELLVAVAILGVVAIFTIPKVLQSQQDTKWITIAKEAAGMVSAGYSAYVLQEGKSASFDPTDLTPYLNYVKIESSGSVSRDLLQGEGTDVCGGGGTPGWCLRLHSGALLMLPAKSFGGTSSTNAVKIQLDPDGGVTGDGNNGPGKSVEFNLYYNGRLTTIGTCFPNTQDEDGVPWGPDPSKDPPWFSWE